MVGRGQGIRSVSIAAVCQGGGGGRERERQEGGENGRGKGSSERQWDLRTHHRLCRGECQLIPSLERCVSMLMLWRSLFPSETFTAESSTVARDTGMVGKCVC